MKRLPRLLLLVFLFVVVWPVHGQTPTTAADYVNRGIEEHQKGDYDGAIADFTKAIEIDPRAADAYMARGDARKNKGDLDGAITDYTKAIEIDPSNAIGYNNLAWLLATASKDSARDGKKAVAYATKACELTKWEDPNALDTLAAAYAEAGDFDEAIKWQTKALSLPEFPQNELDKGRERLQL